MGRLGFSTRTLWALTASALPHGSRTLPREASEQNQPKALQTPPNSAVLRAASRAEHPAMLRSSLQGIRVCCHGQKQAGG